MLLDGDLQDPPELIEQFFSAGRGLDVVYGRRVKREMPLVLEPAYKLSTASSPRFSYVPIPHDAGDFSLMDRRVVGWLLQLPGARPVPARLAGLCRLQADRCRLRAARADVRRVTNSLLKNIGWAKKGIFSFSDTPLTMLTSAGIVALGLSTVAAIVTALLKLFFPDVAAQGATTLQILILMFGSANLFAIGLVGEYVAKIMSEVKARPRLIRAALIRHGKSTELLPDGKAR